MFKPQKKLRLPRAMGHRVQHAGEKDHICLGKSRMAYGEVWHSYGKTMGNGGLIMVEWDLIGFCGI